jgi:DNA-3-methyladenine glycosylase II
LHKTYSQHNLLSFCDDLAQKEPVFANIITKYGLPDLYMRPASFESLLRIILEQQVSLASAKAAYLKLLQNVESIEPTQILALSDDDFKAYYFSRQKTVYARALAQSIIDKKLIINDLITLSDNEVREKLTTIKGIGNWTADVFLMMCLQRCDLFPIGDIALVNSMKKHFQLPKETPSTTLLEMAEAWRPLRSIATIVLWHAYIKERNIVID